MQSISTLIDSGYDVRRSMIAVSSSQVVQSGYVCFVVRGTLQERAINHDVKNDCSYIVFRKVKYKLDVPVKPISGAYNVESLKA